MATKKDDKKMGFREYFHGVRTEMKKVVWPTRSEVISHTAIVIAVCCAFALMFWLIDTGVLAALRAVLGITMN